MPQSRSFPARLTRFARAVLFETAAMFDLRSWFVRWPKFGLDELPAARAWYDEHGWAIVREVFTPEEIATLRGGALQADAAGEPGDLLADPYLGGERYVLHPKLLQVVRAMLPGPPVHFGDASVSVGFQASPAFHKDNPDRLNGEGPDWNSRYSITRFGLYLQDHRTHSGGLALRDRSHNLPSLNQGRPFAVPSSPGDVVLWSLRTTHSGFATRLRGLVTAFLPLTLMALLLGKRYAPPKLLFRPLAAEPRIALFASFGVDDHHLDRFVRQLSTREYAVRQWQATHYDSALRERLAANGVALLDMPERTRHLDPATLNVGFVELAEG